MLKPIKPLKKPPIETKRTPFYLKVSGFPFLLQGFNNTYKSISRMDIGEVLQDFSELPAGSFYLKAEPNDASRLKAEEATNFLFQEFEWIFYLKPYRLYGFFDITGVILFKWNGAWRFIRLQDLPKAMDPNLRITNPFDNPFLAIQNHSFNTEEGLELIGEFYGYYRSPFDTYIVSILP